MKYRENESRGSSIDSSSGEDVFGELARKLPEIAAEIEAEHKKKEKERAERKAKKRRMQHLPGPTSFRLVWNKPILPGIREEAKLEENKKKNRKEDKKEREIKTAGGVKKEEAC